MCTPSRTAYRVSGASIPLRSTGAPEKSARPAQQAARPLPGRLTALEGDRPLLYGADVPLGALEEAAPPGRQVVAHEGRPEGQGVVVDDVEVGQGAHLHRAPVRQAVEAGRVVRLLLHHVLEGQRGTARAVTRPVREHERGHGGVADGPGVRAAVGEAEQAARM